MSKELFAARLKAAMEKQQMKQIDLVRAAAGKGIKLGKSHVSLSAEKHYRVQISCVFWPIPFTRIPAGWQERKTRLFCRPQSRPLKRRMKITQKMP